MTKKRTKLMIFNDKFAQACVSDSFVISINRKDNMFNNLVTVTQMYGDEGFEQFDRKISKDKLRFKKPFIADMMFDVMHAVIEYQDMWRHMIAPIDYTKPTIENGENYVKNSIYLGTYLNRETKGKTKPYDRDAELQRLQQDKQIPVPVSPTNLDVVLETRRIDKPNGLHYVYNLLIKPEDITNGFNPQGLATVEITAFVSKSDADFYAQSSKFFNEFAKEKKEQYEAYRKVNQTRINCFNKITDAIKTNKK